MVAMDNYDLDVGDYGQLALGAATTSVHNAWGSEKI